MRVAPIALGALAAVAACRPADGDPLTRVIPAPPETLSSLDVTMRFEPGASGCVALTADGGLPDLATPGDFCPDRTGTPAEPLPYQSGRRVRVLVDVTAIGTQSTYQFPVTGNITLSLSAGTIITGTPTRIENGTVAGQRVTFQNTPGRMQMWAEAATLLRRPDGSELSPTYSMGASVPLFFGQPTLPDVQRTVNDAISVLDGQRVVVGGENLVVTRVGGNGFTVQDLGAPLTGGVPAWNGIFVFAFNGVDNLRVGSRLLRLRGAVTEFQGMTQLAEPEYVTAGGECAPKQAVTRFGQDAVEPQETEEGGGAIRARCPNTARCVNDRCVPQDDTRHYDRFGRATCHTATTCGGAASSECPSGMACIDREDWRTVDENGAPAFTCQACPTAIGGEYWTTPGRDPGWCGPLYSGDTFINEKLRNEALEGVLVELRDVVVDGLDLNDDFFRSGFESFGQWKVKLPDGACATIVSTEAYPDLDVIAADNEMRRYRSLVGTFRQVRFRSGSAFWMVDLRHRGDLVP